ncbi:Aste57867_16312 [Aphanomyces stellatus]|uniref:Aste57867_16312 protein n=1 Tax=Aphanomyces stellatus TaxID=120398 RepID=A0A485L5D5_9STRA|nr:hypothetical protein As57867_016255 [Aphanomyces stellatus]VFT93088.1 Aste57867_16312 [Aphanomyces stellatus]
MSSSQFSAAFHRFNPLVGSASIGRPLLLLRGLTAVLVLGTSSVSLVNYGLTHVQIVPRPFYLALVVANVATWITIFTHDVLVPFVVAHIQGTNDHLFHQALHSLMPMSSAAAAVSIFAIETYAPVRATATMGRSCTIDAFDRGIQCTSGHVAIGSFDRVVLLVAVAATRACGAIVLACVASHRPRPPRGGRQHATQLSAHLPCMSTVLLPARTQAQVDLGIDECILFGLVPIGLNQVFDVKLWLPFHVTRQHTNHNTTTTG